MIDKRGNNGLNLAALHVAIHMAHEQSFYYSLSGGDKVRFSSFPTSPISSLTKMDPGHLCKSVRARFCASGE